MLIMGPAVHTHRASSATHMALYSLWVALEAQWICTGVPMAYPRVHTGSTEGPIGMFAVGDLWAALQELWVTLEAQWPTVLHIGI